MPKFDRKVKTLLRAESKLFIAITAINSKVQ